MYRDNLSASSGISYDHLDFLRGNFFKIILMHPNGQQPAEPEEPVEQPVFFVHRRLLASLSPELDKHVNNNMKEGIEGQMCLSEVEELTLKAFLCWVYRGDYEA